MRAREVARRRAAENKHTNKKKQLHIQRHFVMTDDPSRHRVDSDDAVTADFDGNDSSQEHLLQARPNTDMSGLAAIYGARRKSAANNRASLRSRLSASASSSSSSSGRSSLAAALSSKRRHVSGTMQGVGGSSIMARKRAKIEESMRQKREADLQRHEAEARAAAAAAAEAKAVEERTALECTLDNSFDGIDLTLENESDDDCKFFDATLYDLETPSASLDESNTSESIEADNWYQTDADDDDGGDCDDDEDLVIVGASDPALLLPAQSHSGGIRHRSAHSQSSSASPVRSQSTPNKQTKRLVSSRSKSTSNIMSFFTKGVPNT
jgi:hypothetical protein